MSNKMVRFAAKAAKAAKRSTHKSFFHGALVIRGGNVISVGYNMTNGAHAEHQALNKMWPDQRIGCTLISVRISKGGKFCMARPCPRCEDMIRSSGIKKVYFTNENRQMEMMRL